MNNSGETAKEKLQLIANTSDLSTAIKRLEIQRAIQEDGLKDHMHILLENLKPKNILKHTIAEVQESTQLKHNLLKVAIGLGAGYFSRKMVVGQSAGIVKKALGAMLQYGVTNFVAKRDKHSNLADYMKPQKKNLFGRVLGLINR
ncbi:MAG: hypothetical protein ABI204_13585 [Ginsengibacter sp.]